jgi:hypothetical protein
VEEILFDLDAEGEPGSLALDQHRVEQLLVAGNPGAAVDAQRLLAAGHLEDQSDVVLLLQMLMRLAWIDVLLIVSPLAAACWVLPQTQGWAQSWNEQFTGAVFTQFVQVVALKLGGLLLVAVLRLEPDVTWLSFLMGAATLWLTWRIPGLMRAGAGGNIADMLAKALVLRSVLRGGGS